MLELQFQCIANGSRNHTEGRTELQWSVSGGIHWLFKADVIDYYIFKFY